MVLTRSQARQLDIPLEHVIFAPERRSSRRLAGLHPEYGIVQAGEPPPHKKRRRDLPRPLQIVISIPEIPIPINTTPIVDESAFSSFPNELMLNILRYATEDAISAMSRTCRRFRLLIRDADELLWETSRLLSPKMILPVEMPPRYWSDDGTYYDWKRFLYESTRVVACYGYRVLSAPEKYVICPPVALRASGNTRFDKIMRYVCAVNNITCKRRLVVDEIAYRKSLRIVFKSIGKNATSIEIFHHVFPVKRLPEDRGRGQTIVIFFDAIHAEEGHEEEFDQIFSSTATYYSAFTINFEKFYDEKKKWRNYASCLLKSSILVQDYVAKYKVY
jgi:hypothetical protein